MKWIRLRAARKAVLSAGIAALAGCTALFGPTVGDRAVTGFSASTDRTAEVRLVWDDVAGSPVYRVFFF